MTRSRFFCQSIVQWRPSLFEKETRDSSELLCRGTLRKRPDFGPSADSRVYLSVALQGPPPVIFPFTLPESEWHRDRSLATRRCCSRQTAATRKSSCSTIHRQSSLGLSEYPSRWAPPGSSDSPLRDPSFCKEAQHHHSAQLFLFSGVRRRGVWGVLPPEKFWIFRLKNARFLSFETPYPMYFHG